MSGVHPTNLFRSDSAAAQSFSAPRNTNLGIQDFDCGLSAVPCLAERFNLKRFARAGIFIFLLALLGNLQGCMYTYFTGTKDVWKQYYGFNDKTLDWILFSTEIFAGFLGLIVSHLGNRHSRASWVGVVAMLYSVSAILLIVPEVYQPAAKDVKEFNVTAVAMYDKLCIDSDDYKHPDEIDPGSKAVGIGIFLIFQFLHALSVVSYATLGLTYLDDHLLDLKNGAMTIGVVLVLHIIGKSIGVYFSWVPVSFNKYIFVSFVWIFLTIMVMLVGFLLSMFPKSLPSAILERGASSILEIARGTRRRATIVLVKKGFLHSMRRLVTNRVLLLSIIASTFMNIARTNFTVMQDDFYRARFIDVSGGEYSGDSTRTLVNPKQILQPISGSMLMMSSVLITRFNPRAAALAGWNVFVYTMAAFLFVSYAFMTCEDTIHSAPDRCSWNCECSKEVFIPICVQAGNERVTYFSPCYASCKRETDKGYAGCTCDNYIATRGSCGSDKCNSLYMFAQSSAVITNGLLASAFMAHFLISIRSVEVCDKALALGFHITITQLIPYFPFTFLYELIKETLCTEHVNGTCVFYKDAFPVLLSTVTCGFMLLAALTTCFVAKFSSGLLLYGKEEKNEEQPRAEDEQTMYPLRRQSQVVNEESEPDELPKNSSSTVPSMRSSSEDYTEYDIIRELSRSSGDSHLTNRPHETNL